VGSSGKIISLNTKTWRADLVQHFPAPEGVFAATQGSTQVLQNGNVFISWGSAGAVSEFLPNGTVIFHAHLDSGKLFEEGDLQNYRGFKFNWTGTPAETPAIVALKHGEYTMIYVSWNETRRQESGSFMEWREEIEFRLERQLERALKRAFMSEATRSGIHLALKHLMEKALASSGVTRVQEYIYQYVPGRDDMAGSVLEHKEQKVLRKIRY